MKVKGLIAAALAAVMLAGTAVYAADADDIAGIVAKNAPTGERLEHVLNLKATEEDIYPRDFTDPKQIYMQYTLDGDKLEKYSGSFAALIDDAKAWYLPVVKNGKVVDEYIYAEAGS